MMLFICIVLHLMILVSSSSSTWMCTDENGNSLGGTPNCGASKVIAIEGVEAQVIVNSTVCHKNDLISSTSGEEKCCLLNNINACTVGTLSPDVFQQYCSGRSDCMFFQNRSDLFGCNSTISGSKRFSLDYSCIRRSNVKEMCKPWSIAAPFDSIYIVNDHYLPTTTSTNESFKRVPVSNNGCSCSIEVDACNVNLTVFSVHVDFVSELGVCKQSMDFFDSQQNIQYSLGCGNRALERLYTTRSNYINIQFHNSLSRDGGAFWIGIKGTANDTFTTTLSCPSKTQKYCRVSSTSFSMILQSSTDMLLDESGTSLSTILQSSTDILLDESAPEGLSCTTVIAISIATSFVLLIAAVAVIAKLTFSRRKRNRIAMGKFGLPDCRDVVFNTKFKTPIKR